MTRSRPDWTDRERQRDADSLQSRLEALQLPVVPVRRHKSLSLPAPLTRGWLSTPAAVGIGPRDDAIALWRRSDGTPGAIVRHVRGESSDERVLPFWD